MVMISKLEDIYSIKVVLNRLMPDHLVVLRNSVEPYKIMILNLETGTTEGHEVKNASEAFVGEKLFLQIKKIREKDK